MKAETRARLRLLPPDSSIGWTAYVWLMYLPTLLIEPIQRTRQGTASAAYWVITIAGLAAFLVSYFRGYWVHGVRLRPVVGFQTALAAALSPINVGASVLFIYAGAFAGRLDSAREALRILLAVAAVAFLTAWLIDAPGFYWVSAAMTLVIGGVKFHDTQQRHAEQMLGLAHDDIRHLAAVAERERIARDLHDVLGHTLSLIVLKSELAGRLVPVDPERATREIRDVEEVTRRTLKDVREAIRGYHPTLLEEADSARAMLDAARIESVFELADAPVPVAVHETLALALRESVTNVIRHSGASNCRVELTVVDETATLRVCDDGRGSRAPAGRGLSGMADRVHALGGSLVLRSSPGVTLTVTLPTAVG